MDKSPFHSPSPQDSPRLSGFTQHHRPVIAVHSGECARGKARRPAPRTHPQTPGVCHSVVCFMEEFGSRCPFLTPLPSSQGKEPAPPPPAAVWWAPGVEMPRTGSPASETAREFGCGGLWGAERSRIWRPAHCLAKALGRGGFRACRPPPGSHRGPPGPAGWKPVWPPTVPSSHRVATEPGAPGSHVPKSKFGHCTGCGGQPFSGPPCWTQDPELCPLRPPRVSPL